MRTCLTRAQGIKNLSVFLNLIITAITCLLSTANGVSAQRRPSNLGASLHESERAAQVRALNNSSFNGQMQQARPMACPSRNHLGPSYRFVIE
jgi:hypothetical protein